MLGYLNNDSTSMHYIIAKYDSVKRAHNHALHTLKDISG